MSLLNDGCDLSKPEHSPGAARTHRRTGRGRDCLHQRPARNCPLQSRARRSLDTALKKSSGDRWTFFCRVDSATPIAPHDSVRQGEVVARRMGERTEVLGLRKDGSEFSAEASISKQEQGALIFTAVVRDITERKKIELEIRQ